MRMKRIITVLCCLFAAVFIAAATVDFTAKDKLYPLLFDSVDYDCTADYEPRNTSLQKGDFVLYGTYRGEQMLWRVISEDGTVIQSNYIVDFAPFGKSSDKNDSDLMKNLGKNFDGITEKIYIPSESELSKLSAAELKKQPTLSAVLRCKTRFLFLRRNCWYWTSSGISTNFLSVAAVTQSGTFYKSPATDSLMGVCPAVKLESKDVLVTGGNGTAEQPYVIGGEQ